MTKYRKKPVIVEAIEFTRENVFKKKIENFTQGKLTNIKIPRCPDGVMTGVIETLEGPHIAAENDYIIKGIAGEFYPCKPDIFKATYEKVE